jgi:hypothetical protein
MKATDISFLRRQAEHCIALSRATFDLTIASRLRTMADEFQTRASQLEDDHEAVPTHVMRRNGSSNGKDRD